MEPKEAASHATAALYELRRHAEVYDTAFERRDVLEQARAETEAAATKASEDLRYEEAMLRELEKKIVGQRHILDNMRSISTNEIDAEIARLKLQAMGIAIESRVTWASGAVSLYFRDPDNHAVELGTPGIWG